MTELLITELKSGFDQIRSELSDIRRLLAARRRDSELREPRYRLAATRFESALKRYARACQKAGFNPGQPRVPAGSREGGQWTSDDTPGRVRFGDASSALGSSVMSDATPDPIRPGAQYAQTQIEIKPSALTSDPRIDNTTVKLTTTLAEVMDVVESTPGLTPQEYGRLVHEKFADITRVQGLPGIAYDDVETTFGGAYYGAKGSIRTDVVLRDEGGKIIAIYDVKTGDATIGAARAAELRAKTGAGKDVPIIELQAIHGVTRKAVSARYSQNSGDVYRTCFDSHSPRC
jgi:hypothetical protein